MILTKRERLLTILAGTGVALFAIYYFALDPLVLKPLSDARAQLAAKLDEQHKNKGVLDERAAWNIKWKEFQAQGLTMNPSEAQGELARAMTDWIRGDPRSNAPPVTFVSQAASPRDVTLNGDMYFEKTLVFTGSGNAAGIEHLLWNIEHSPMPVRLNRVQITAHKEGVDDLGVDVNVSTICPNPDAKGTAAH